MKKKMNRLAQLATGALLAGGTAFAFEWPQTPATMTTFFSYFGQRRGGTIQSSLIFTESTNIRAVDDGTVVAIISEHDDEFGWFESPLGNAVIISHPDKMSTVYANLDRNALPDTLESMDDIASGTPLGSSGSSGWQEGQSGLEFMVLDTKNSTSVNPRELMPRLYNELPLDLGLISLDDANGGTHYLRNERNFPSGTYRVYHPRQNVVTPYRTSVAVNGTTVETISYDTLKAVDGKLCATGGRAYTIDQLYPDDTRQLVGTVQLTRGQAVLTLTLTDIIGNVRTTAYTLYIS